MGVEFGGKTKEERLEPSTNKMKTKGTGMNVSKTGEGDVTWKWRKQMDVRLWMPFTGIIVCSKPKTGECGKYTRSDGVVCSLEGWAMNTEQELARIKAQQPKVCRICGTMG